MFVITPTSGSQIAVSSAICPKPRIASSSTRTSVPAGAASSSSGSPISVLKLAREAATVRCGAIRAAIRSFVDVFPTEPVTPITCAPSARRQPRARPPSAATGSAAARTAPPSSVRAHSGVASTPHAPAASASAAKRPPSTRSPGIATNRSPGAIDARVDDHARRTAVAVAQQVGAGRAGDPLGVPVPHARATARNASRATATSSKGSLRPPANSCPCSWPLPAMTTTSPGAASAIAAPIASRRSTTCFT